MNRAIRKQKIHVRLGSGKRDTSNGGAAKEPRSWSRRRRTNIKLACRKWECPCDFTGSLQKPQRHKLPCTIQKRRIAVKRNACQARQHGRMQFGFNTGSGEPQYLLYSLKTSSMKGILRVEAFGTPGWP